MYEHVVNKNLGLNKGGKPQRVDFPIKGLMHFCNRCDNLSVINKFTVHSWLLITFQSNSDVLSHYNIRPKHFYLQSPQNISFIPRCRSSDAST